MNITLGRNCFYVVGFTEHGVAFIVRAQNHSSARCYGLGAIRGAELLSGKTSLIAAVLPGDEDDLEMYIGMGKLKREWINEAQERIENQPIPSIDSISTAADNLEDPMFQDLKTGNAVQIVRNHVYRVTALDTTGIHTGRRRFAVFCTSCRESLHSGSTGPKYYVLQHEKEIAPRYVPVGPGSNYAKQAEVAAKWAKAMMLICLCGGTLEETANPQVRHCPRCKSEVMAG